MGAPNRFEIVAPLTSPLSHLHVAVDRGSHPARAVVLALYPRALSDDPGRLGRLCAEVELAAQLFHPNIVAPVGIEAVGDDLAAVTIWRDALTLREILDAGRLPGDIAARIAADVCAGIAHAHGRPEPVVHGLLRPEAVLVDESGTAAVSGFGMPGGSGISDDLLGVGELLHECLVGEPPEGPSVPLSAPDLPLPLTAVVNKARAANREDRHPSAEALGAAIGEAVPLASREAVAAYLEAILPAGSGLRAETRRKIEAALAAPASTPTPEELSEEISDDDIVAAAVLSDDDIVGAATPLPGDVAAAASPALTPVSAPDRLVVPTASATPASGHVSAAASPARTPASTLDRLVPTASATPASVSTSPQASRSTLAKIAAEPGPAAEDFAASKEREFSRPTALPVDATARVRGPIAGRGPRVSLAGAIAMCLGGAVGGFALARLAPGIPFLELTGASAGDVRARAEPRTADPVPAAAALAETSPSAPARRAAEPAPAKKRQIVRHADARELVNTLGSGVLVVTAPADAEVWLDGRRIGKGSTRKQVPAGSHRIEVRQGRAKVSEPFRLEGGETWTYAVTPQR